MNLPGPQHLGFAYLASELLLTISRRSTRDGVRQDRGTLRVLWIVIVGSVVAGIYLATHFHTGALPHPVELRGAALTVFVLGIAIRWWAIITLGRFFTVDVQISNDHQLVERGPFRVVRHPSYTGLLVAFLGFALSLANWIALLIVMLPIFAALIWRIRVEEQALSNALGATYESYVRRTKRLLPAIY